jgi:flagellar biosynthesis protein FlhG
MAQLSVEEHARLIRAFGELSFALDVLLIDTAAGISESVMTFNRAAQEVVVVVCDEPTSITDAYALIKVLSRDYGVDRFHILANMVSSTTAGQELYNRFSRVTNRFLDVTLDFLGTVPYDEYLPRAVQEQRTLMEISPNGKGALAFRRLAAKMEAWPPPTHASGHLGFFIERLIQSGSGRPQ